ncbi:MAG: hypothetical protein NT138_04435, partial [Planctomycetales bacterium]|nr:hypothetical protein [Planctomycetales bacterium]
LTVGLLPLRDSRGLIFSLRLRRSTPNLPVVKIPSRINLSGIRRGKNFNQLKRPTLDMNIPQ